MPKVGTSLKGVGKGCAKPNCKARTALQRHHRRHQAMWLGVWAGRRRSEKKWIDFRDRYYKYHEKDCVKICPSHHAEIHTIYDEIIASDIVEVGKPLANYSWPQAERLMDKLEKACDYWLRHESKGFSSKRYHETKLERRKLAQRDAIMRKFRDEKRRP